VRYSSRAAKSKVISAGAVEPILRFFEAGGMVDLFRMFGSNLGTFVAKVAVQIAQRFERGGERFRRCVWLVDWDMGTRLLSAVAQPA
jgi:hypothetical protein